MIPAQLLASLLALALPSSLALPTLYPADDGPVVGLAAGPIDEAAQLAAELLTTPAKRQRPVRLALAQVLLDTGSAQEALDTLAPLPLAEDGEATKLTGLIFAALGDEIEFGGGAVEDADYFYGEALQYLENAAALAQGKDTDAAVEAAYLALYIFADWSKAEVLADDALARAPDDGEALLARGCARVRGFADMERHMTPSLRRDNWDVAVADLKRAVTLLGADRSEPWWQLIWMYEQENLPDEALAAALAHHDATGRADSSTLLRLALSFARAQQLDPALAALRALVERDPDGLLANLRASEDPTADVVALSWAMGPLLAKRRQSEARDLLHVLGQAEPADADFWNNLAFLCRETRQYEDSYAAYERAVAIDDSSPRLLNDTALILQYHLHRHLDRARALYAQAIAQADAGLDEKPDAAAARELRSARTDARNNLSRLGSKGR